MNEQEKQAMLHHEAMQKQAAKPPNSGGFSGAVDDIRHKVVEEPYWLRPEGRTTTDDIAPKVRDFYESAPEQESQSMDSVEAETPDYTAQQMQEAYGDFMGVEKDGKGQETERAQESQRELGL